MKEGNNNYVLLLRSCVPLISSVNNGDQIGENSRLGWLIEFPAHVICVASLYKHLIRIIQFFYLFNLFIPWFTPCNL
jgi:hypothetical protein